MGNFQLQPNPERSYVLSLTVVLKESEFAQFRVATGYGAVDSDEFARQAILYAIANMEQDDADGS